MIAALRLRSTEPDDPHVFNEWSSTETPWILPCTEGAYKRALSNALKVNKYHDEQHEEERRRREMETERVDLRVDEDSDASGGGSPGVQQKVKQLRSALLDGRFQPVTKL
jgi:hypothetical protein